MGGGEGWDGPFAVTIAPPFFVFLNPWNSFFYIKLIEIHFGPFFFTYLLVFCLLVVVVCVWGRGGGGGGVVLWL